MASKDEIHYRKPPSGCRKKKKPSPHEGGKRSTTVSSNFRKKVSHWNLSSTDEALQIIRRFFDEDHLYVKTGLALDELFSN